MDITELMASPGSHLIRVNVRIEKLAWKAPAIKNDHLNSLLRTHMAEEDVNPEIHQRKTSSTILAKLKQAFIKRLNADQDGIW